MKDKIRRRTLLLVEGHTDLEFIGKLLRSTMPGLCRIKARVDLDPFWNVLTNLKFPQSGDLTKRMDVPGFFQNDCQSIAIVSANSVGLLVAAARRDLSNLRPNVPDGVGFILDADKEETPERRFIDLSTQAGQVVELTAFQMPQRVGIVSEKEGHCMGAFIMPDNSSIGTLEDVLLQCAEACYPELYAAANRYVRDFDIETISAKERRGEIGAPSGRKKATASAISAVLKPAKSLQVSIHDNRWLSEDSLGLSNVLLMRKFLGDLLNEPSMAQNDEKL